jgi:hypothetical protein
MPTPHAPQFVVGMKALSLLLFLFAKRACARYRFTAGYGNTPYPRKEYYHTRLPIDIACRSARSTMLSALRCVARSILAVRY